MNWQKLTRPMFNRLVRVRRNDLLERKTAVGLQFAEDHLVSDDMKSDDLGCPEK